MENFNFLIPKVVQVWNPTEEVLELQYDARTIVLNPGQMIDAPEQAAKDIHRLYSHLGVVVIKPGDRPEAKKKESILAIYESLFQQLKNWNSFKDDSRHKGYTPIGEYRRVTQIKRQMAAIEESLELEPRLDKEFYETLEKQRALEELKKTEPLKRGLKPKNVDLSSA